MKCLLFFVFCFGFLLLNGTCDVLYDNAYNPNGRSDSAFELKCKEKYPDKNPKTIIQTRRSGYSKVSCCYD